MLRIWTPYPPHPHRSTGQLGGEEAGAVAAGEFPKMSPRVVFLLRKSSCSIQGRACPLTQPISPARPGTVWVRAPHGPALNSPQLVPIVFMCLPLRPYSPPCDFKQPGLSWCCSSLVWQGRKALTGLSQESCGKPSGRGPGDAVALVPVLVPGTFLY